MLRLRSIEPKELLEQLEGLRGARGTAEDRRYERKSWAVVLTLQIQEGSGTYSTQREVEVTTHDISVSGFAFVYRQFLHKGTYVAARFDMLPNRPTLTGVVRNCTLLEGAQHRIGVEFLPPNDSGG